MAGVYTYGSCAAGDAEFVRKLQAAYPERLVAHRHPQDVCSLWCPPGGYAALPGDACSALPQGQLTLSKHRRKAWSWVGCACQVGWSESP